MKYTDDILSELTAKRTNWKKVTRLLWKNVRAEHPNIRDSEATMTVADLLKTCRGIKRKGIRP